MLFTDDKGESAKIIRKTVRRHYIQIIMTGINVPSYTFPIQSNVFASMKSTCNLKTPPIDGTNEVRKVAKQPRPPPLRKTRIHTRLTESRGNWHL